MTCLSEFRTSEGKLVRCGLDAGHTGDIHGYSVRWASSEQYVPPPPPPTVREQLVYLRTKFPDAAAIPEDFGPYGGFTLKFTMPLSNHWNLTQAWVAFDVPAGFPAAVPSNFYADPELRTGYGGYPRKTGNYDHQKLGHCMIFFGNVQAWNPNHCTLHTYAQVMRHALLRLQ